MNPAALYAPPDVHDAYDAWGANCGPCALAAVLSLPVQDAHALVTPFRGYMNSTDVRRAVARSGKTVRRVDGKGYDWRHRGFPGERGLAHILWAGPWSSHPRYAYRHSHWIGYGVTGDHLQVYDVNAGETGGWLAFVLWEVEVAPRIAARHRGATLAYQIGSFLEVLP